MRALILALFILLSSPAAADVDAHKLLFDPKVEWLNTTRPLAVADAKGRMVLLDFWTYGCINCMHIVPDLKKLEQEFGDKLLVIGVHSAKFEGEKGGARILAAARRFGLEHPVINDSSFDIWDAFEVRAWPTLVLLGPDGDVLEKYTGEGHYAEIREEIADNLEDVTATSTLKGIVPAEEKKGVLRFPALLGFANETPWGETLFVADSGNHRLLGLSVEGKVKVIIGSGEAGAKDGDFKTASFRNPRGFGIAKNGIYVADTENHLIRFIDFEKKTVSTVAGTGVQGYDRRVRNSDALKTAISSPWDVKVMPDHKTLAIAMAGTHQLWSYNTADKTLSVLAGTGKESIDDGEALSSSLSQPSGLAPWGDTLYFVDAETSSLRSLKFGQVSTLVGTGLFDFGHLDGNYPKARMQHAQGLDVDGGRVVIADTYNNAIRIYDTKTGELSTVPVAKEALDEPGDVLQLNGKLYVADTNHFRIAVIDPKTGVATALPIKTE